MGGSGFSQSVSEMAKRLFSRIPHYREKMNPISNHLISHFEPYLRNLFQLDCIRLSSIGLRDIFSCSPLVEKPGDEEPCPILTFQLEFLIFAPTFSAFCG